jgi:PAS domain S-box-containing protein
MKQGAIFHSSEGRIIHANRAAEKILGFTLEQMKEMTLDNPGWRFITENGSEMAVSDHPSMMALGTGREVHDLKIGIENMEMEKLTWIEIDAIPLSTADQDEPNQVLTLFEDITEKKNLEDSLKKNERMFTRMAENIKDIFWIMDLDLRVTYISPSIERFSGYTPAEYMEIGLEGSISRKDLAEVLEGINEGMEEEKEGLFPEDVSRRIEFKMIRKDGNEVWAEAIASFLRDEEGNPIGILGVTRDIAEKKEYEEELRRSEAKYRHLFESAGDAIMITRITPQGPRFVACNKKAESMFGAEMGGLINADPMMLSPPEQPDGSNSQQSIMKNIGRVISGETVHLEWIHRKLDGTDFPCEVTLSGNVIDGERVIQGIVRDITDRRKAEEELKQSKERYRLLVENALETILVAQDSKIKFINKAGGNLTGIPSGDMIGRPFIEFIHPDDRKKVGDSYKKRIKGDFLPKYSFRVLREDGSIHWAEIEAVRIEWEGSPATLNFISDITERKKAEEELKENEWKYRTLFETANDAIFLMKDDRFIDCNSSTLKMFGCNSRDQIIGHSPYEFSPENQPNGRGSREVAMEKIEGALNSGPQSFEWVHRRLGGTEFPTEVTLNKMELGDSTLIQAIVRDITEHKKSRDLIEWERNRAEFYLDLLSHDIGNIHQGLQAWTAILRARSNDETERTRSLRKIDELGKRSIKLVKNVLLLSRLKDMRSELSPIDLLPVLKKTIRDMRSLFMDREMEITVSTDVKSVSIKAETVIEEIFFNLLHNGIKFQYEDPVLIDICIERTSRNGRSFFELSFADHGIGVSDDKKHNLFDRHVKGSDYGYSGIGLSLVKELVTRYDGYMEVRDRIPGDHTKGAVFIIYLPSAD